MPGPVPKPSGTRQRRNRASSRAILPAEDNPRQRAPSLPKPIRVTRKRKGEEVESERAWHALAVHWWETIWSSPLAGEFIRADEPAIIRTFMLVDRFGRTGSLEVAKEIRMMEDRLGLTPIARRRLEWSIDQGEAAKDRVQRREEERSRKNAVKAQVLDADEVLS